MHRYIISNNCRTKIMEINVTNLGPIKQASLKIGGLTVFVGPNGTGKSYLGKVIYGLRRPETLTDNLTRDAARFYKIIFNQEMTTLQQAIEHLQQLTPAAYHQAIPKLAKLHAELFKKRLSEFFNDDSNLFENSTISFAGIKELDENELQNTINIVLNSNFLQWPEDRRPSPGIIAISLSISPFWEVNRIANYFPASRTYFMLNYKALIHARANDQVGVISMSALLANQPKTIGPLQRFDKPTEDFIDCLYNLDASTRKPYALIADKLQNSLYGKDQLQVNQGLGSLADFYYQLGDKPNKIRLHLSSSMVTETSPLLVGLWHWIESGNLVVIDEPESHLHPEAQRKLVYGLAEAVNQGLNLILITHSPYILSCVNNLIKFNKINNEYPDDKNLQMLKQQHPDLVALDKPVHAYNFKLDGTVDDIVLENGLIDEAEFTLPFDRINALYEEMRDIEWDHK